MAFLKKCEGTVLKCSECSNPGIKLVAGVWFCQNCAEKKLKKSKKTKKETPKN